MFDEVLSSLTPDQQSLLETLFQMAREGAGKHAGDGLRSGPVPFFVTTSSWRDVAVRWYGDATPGFGELRRTRETLEALAEQQLDVHGLAIRLVAVDPSGIEEMPVRITLSSYVPMLLAELEPSPKSR